MDTEMTKPSALAAEKDLLLQCKRIYEDKLQKLQVRHTLHDLRPPAQRLIQTVPPMRAGRGGRAKTPTTGE